MWGVAIGYASHEEAKRMAVVESLDKARVVLAVLAERPGASLTEVARAAGMPVSTARWHLERLRRWNVVVS